MSQCAPAAQSMRHPPAGHVIAQWAPAGHEQVVPAVQDTVIGPASVATNASGGMNASGGVNASGAANASIAYASMGAVSCATNASVATCASVPASCVVEPVSGVSVPPPHPKANDETRKMIATARIAPS